MQIHHLATLYPIIHLQVFAQPPFVLPILAFLCTFHNLQSRLLILGLVFKYSTDPTLCVNLIIGEGMSVSDLMVLPKRNVGTYLKGCLKQNVKTNLFKVEFSDKALITIYSLTLDPQIPKDSSKLSMIIGTVDSQLTQQIGNYLVSGRNIFGCQFTKNKGRQTAVKIDANLGIERYSLSLKPVRVVDLANLNSSKQGETFLPLNFFNNLMKKFFASMKFTQIGRNGKFFNPKSRKVVENAGVILFDGYDTNFNITENGLYLQVDSMVRIIQNRTVLEQIDRIYASNAHLSKDQKRQILSKQLINKAVMANYGNSKIWIVKEIIFDFDLENTRISSESNENFIQYYQRSYGIKIRKKKQPVLKAVMNGSQKKNDGKQFILIPELLLLSGLPEDFDQKKRRSISQFTIINPDEKFNRIQSLMSSFNSDTENFCPNSVRKSLGVKFSEATETAEAVILPTPTLQLGGGQAVQKPKVANFQLFNKQIYNHEVPVSVVAFIPHDFDFLPVQKIFISTCRNLCLKNNLNVIRINFQDGKKCMSEIEKLIEDKSGKFDDFDLNWFILPPSLKSYYKTIKILSLKQGNPKVTQVTLTTTLAKKGFASIFTKILLQISCKLGNVAWAPKNPTSIPQRTMLVGVSSHRLGKNIVVGYCCTLNKQMSKFHSNYHFQNLCPNFCAKMGDIIADCLASYSRAASALPDQIIIIKTDVSDGEKDNIELELSQVREKLRSVPTYNPRLTFMTANKNSKQKFFLESRNMMNPGHGTLINSKVVSKNYDFYLIAQQCNRGTVKPVHYKVLFTDSKIEEGVLQEFIYDQSFNYMNWSGSVRVPSVLQYSTKLCDFVTEHIGDAPKSDQLNEKLYFI